jgi:hypothetical protein
VAYRSNTLPLIATPTTDALTSAADTARVKAARRTAPATMCVALLLGPRLGTPAAPHRDPWHMCAITTPQRRVPAATLPTDPSLAHSWLTVLTVSHRLPLRPRAHQCGQYCSGVGCAADCTGSDRVRCTRLRAPAAAAPRPLAHVCHHDPAAARANCDAADWSLTCTLVTHRSNTLPSIATPTARAHQCGQYCSGVNCATRCTDNQVRCTRAATLGTCLPSRPRSSACLLRRCRPVHRLHTRGPPF